MLTVPTAKHERFAEFYNLSLISKDTVISLGFSANEKVSVHQLVFQLKLLIEDGAGFHCCVSFASWVDQDQQRNEPDWSMMQIALVTLAKIPAISNCLVMVLHQHQYCFHLPGQKTVRYSPSKHRRQNGTFAGISFHFYEFCQCEIRREEGIGTTQKRGNWSKKIKEAATEPRKHYNDYLTVLLM